MNNIPSRPQHARRQHVSFESGWFRGVEFIREVAGIYDHDRAGSVRWVMVFPVRGPHFSNMNDARSWCRQNGIQHPDWNRGMSGNPSNW